MTHKRDDMRDALRTLNSSAGKSVKDDWMTHKKTVLGVSTYALATDKAYWCGIGGLGASVGTSTEACMRAAIIATVGSISTTGTPTNNDYERKYWAAVNAGSYVPALP